MTADQYIDLIGFLGQKFGKIDERFDALDGRMDGFEGRPTKVEVKMKVCRATFGFWRRACPP